MPLTDKRVTAVVICYNDRGSIDEMYRRLTATLKKITDDYEIVYVNENSPDNAEELLREYAAKDPRLTVVLHARNFGSQNAFTSGMKHSTGDAVALLDGDLQDPPELLEEMAKKWLAGYDVVYGIRKKRKGSLLRRIAYKIFYRLFKKMSYVNMPLDAGDFSLMDRKVVNALLKLPERDRFIRGLRAWVGFKQTGIEYTRDERFSGKTTNTFWSNLRWAKKGIFSFSYAPLELISFISAIVTLISGIALIIYIIGYFIFPRGPKGTQTIIVLILFLGSIQLLSLSIIGEYLGRIFEEVKQRPKYIVKEVINDHREDK
jgi:dolichol-phosphate mannosyltransferase